MNKRALLPVLTLIALGRMCEGQEKTTTPEDTQPGVVQTPEVCTATSATVRRGPPIRLNTGRAWDSTPRSGR